MNMANANKSAKLKDNSFSLYLQNKSHHNLTEEECPIEQLTKESVVIQNGMFDVYKIKNHIRKHKDTIQKIHLTKCYSNKMKRFEIIQTIFLESDLLMMECNQLNDISITDLKITCQEELVEQQLPHNNQHYRGLYESSILSVYSELRAHLILRSSIGRECNGRLVVKQICFDSKHAFYYLIHTLQRYKQSIQAISFVNILDMKTNPLKAFCELIRLLPNLSELQFINVLFNDKNILQVRYLLNWKQQSLIKLVFKKIQLSQFQLKRLFFDAPNFKIHHLTQLKDVVFKCNSQLSSTPLFQQVNSILNTIVEDNALKDKDVTNKLSKNEKAIKDKIIKQKLFEPKKIVVRNELKEWQFSSFEKEIQQPLKMLFFQLSQTNFCQELDIAAVSLIGMPEEMLDYLIKAVCDSLTLKVLKIQNYPDLLFLLLANFQLKNQIRLNSIEQISDELEIESQEIQSSQKQKENETEQHQDMPKIQSNQNCQNIIQDSAIMNLEASLTINNNKNNIFKVNSENSNKNNNHNFQVGSDNIHKNNHFKAGSENINSSKNKTFLKFLINKLPIKNEGDQMTRDKALTIQALQKSMNLQQINMEFASKEKEELSFDKLQLLSNQINLQSIEKSKQKDKSSKSHSNAIRLIKKRKMLEELAVKASVNNEFGENSILSIVGLMQFCEKVVIDFSNSFLSKEAITGFIEGYKKLKELESQGQGSEIKEFIIQNISGSRRLDQLSWFNLGLTTFTCINLSSFQMLNIHLNSDQLNSLLKGMLQTKNEDRLIQLNSFVIDVTTDDEIDGIQVMNLILTSIPLQQLRISWKVDSTLQTKKRKLKLSTSKSLTNSNLSASRFQYSYNNNNSINNYIQNSLINMQPASAKGHKSIVPSQFSNTPQDKIQGNYTNNNNNNNSINNNFEDNEFFKLMSSQNLRVLQLTYFYNMNWNLLLEQISLKFENLNELNLQHNQLTLEFVNCMVTCAPFWQLKQLKKLFLNNNYLRIKSSYNPLNANNSNSNNINLPQSFLFYTESVSPTILKETREKSFTLPLQESQSVLENNNNNINTSKDQPGLIAPTDNQTQFNKFQVKPEEINIFHKTSNKDKQEDQKTILFQDDENDIKVLMKEFFANIFGMVSLNELDLSNNDLTDCEVDIIQSNILNTHKRNYILDFNHIKLDENEDISFSNIALYKLLERPSPPNKPPPSESKIKDSEGSKAAHTSLSKIKKRGQDLSKFMDSLGIFEERNIQQIKLTASVDLTESNAQIQHLILSNCQISGELVDQLLQFVKSNFRNQLTLIDLSQNPLINLSHWTTIIQTIFQYQGIYLKSLILRQCQFGNSHIFMIANTLQSHSNHNALNLQQNNNTLALDSIDLSSNPFIDKDGWYELIKVLFGQLHIQLRSIILQSCQINTTKVHYLLNGLKDGNLHLRETSDMCLRCLEQIDLNDNPISQSLQIILQRSFLLSTVLEQQIQQIQSTSQSVLSLLDFIQSNSLQYQKNIQVQPQQTLHKQLQPSNQFQSFLPQNTKKPNVKQLIIGENSSKDIDLFLSNILHDFNFIEELTIKINSQSLKKLNLILLQLIEQQEETFFILEGNNNNSNQNLGGADGKNRELAELEGVTFIFELEASNNIPILANRNICSGLKRATKLFQQKRKSLLANPFKNQAKSNSYLNKEALQQLPPVNKIEGLEQCLTLEASIKSPIFSQHHKQKNKTVNFGRNYNFTSISEKQKPLLKVNFGVEIFPQKKEVNRNNQKRLSCFQGDRTNRGMKANNQNNNNGLNHIQMQSRNSFSSSEDEEDSGDDEMYWEQIIVNLYKLSPYKRLSLKYCHLDTRIFSHISQITSLEAIDVSNSNIKYHNSDNNSQNDKQKKMSIILPRQLETQQQQQQQQQQKKQQQQQYQQQQQQQSKLSAGLEQLLNLRGLLEIKLNNIEVGPLMFTRLAECIYKCRQQNQLLLPLSRIDLSGASVYIKSDDWQKLITSLLNNTSLKALILVKCNLFKDNVIGFIQAILQSNNTFYLEEVNLSGNRAIYPNQWGSIIVNLFNRYKIKRLNISDCAIYEDKLSKIIDNMFIHQIKSLEVFDISNNNISHPDHLFGLLYVLSQVPTIIEINLSNCQLSKKATQLFNDQLNILSFTSVPHNSHLKILKLNNNECLLDSYLHCYTFLNSLFEHSSESFSQMKELHLDNCLNDRNKVQQFIQSLKLLSDQCIQLNSITTISIQYNRIQSNQYIKLLPLIGYVMPNIETLMMGFNTVLVQSSHDNEDENSIQAIRKGIESIRDHFNLIRLQISDDEAANLIDWEKLLKELFTKVGKSLQHLRVESRISQTIKQQQLFSGLCKLLKKKSYITTYDQTKKNKCQNQNKHQQVIDIRSVSFCCKDRSYVLSNEHISGLRKNGFFPMYENGRICQLQLSQYVLLFWDNIHTNCNNIVVKLHNEISIMRFQDAFEQDSFSSNLKLRSDLLIAMNYLRKHINCQSNYILEQFAQQPTSHQHQINNLNIQTEMVSLAPISKDSGLSKQTSIMVKDSPQALNQYEATLNRQISQDTQINRNSLAYNNSQDTQINRKDNNFNMINDNIPSPISFNHNSRRQRSNLILKINYTYNKLPIFSVPNTFIQPLQLNEVDLTYILKGYKSLTFEYPLYIFFIQTCNLFPSDSISTFFVRFIKSLASYTFFQQDSNDISQQYFSIVQASPTFFLTEKDRDRIQTALTKYQSKNSEQNDAQTQNRAKPTSMQNNRLSEFSQMGQQSLPQNNITQSQNTKKKSMQQQYSQNELIPLRESSLSKFKEKKISQHQQLIQQEQLLMEVTSPQQSNQENTLRENKTKFDDRQSNLQQRQDSSSSANVNDDVSFANKSQNDLSCISLVPNTNRVSVQSNIINLNNPHFSKFKSLQLNENPSMTQINNNNYMNTPKNNNPRSDTQIIPLIKNLNITFSNIGLENTPNSKPQQQQQSQQYHSNEVKTKKVWTVLCPYYFSSSTTSNLEEIDVIRRIQKMPPSELELKGMSISAIKTIYAFCFSNPYFSGCQMDYNHSVFVNTSLAWSIRENIYKNYVTKKINYFKHFFQMIIFTILEVFIKDNVFYKYDNSALMLDEYYSHKNKQHFFLSFLIIFYHLLTSIIPFLFYDKRGTTYTAHFIYIAFAALTLIIEYLLIKDLLQKIIHLAPGIQLYKSQNTIFDKLKHKLVSQTMIHYKLLIYMFYLIYGQFGRFNTYSDVCFLVLTMVSNSFSIFLMSGIILIITKSITIYRFISFIHKAYISNKKQLPGFNITKFYEAGIQLEFVGFSDLLNIISPYNVTRIPKNALTKWLFPKISGQSMNQRIFYQLIRISLEDIPQIFLQISFLIKETNFFAYISLVMSFISLTFAMSKVFSLRPSIISQLDFDELKIQKQRENILVLQQFQQNELSMLQHISKLNYSINIQNNSKSHIHLTPKSNKYHQKYQTNFASESQPSD